MSKKVVEKAMAYITWGNRLLLFIHTAYPEAGIQVPAGTIHPGESPEEAVLREAREETGLEGLKLRSYLGARDVDQTPWGKEAVHRRHFFHLEFAGQTAERWKHYENDPSDGSLAPIEFELYWVRVPDEVPDLIAGLGDMLPALYQTLNS